MLKDILKLEGTKQLDKKGQNEISGGHNCPHNCTCLPNQVVQVNIFTGFCFCVPA